MVSERMMPIQHQGKKIFLCEVCGFGYSDAETATSCENFCKAHNSCSFEITRKAVFRPEA